MFVKRFLKYFSAASLFALQFLDRCADVLDGWWPLMFLMADNDFEFGIDLQLCFTAWALDLEQLVLTLAHIGDGNANAACYGNGRSGL